MIGSFVHTRRFLLLVSGADFYSQIIAYIFSRKELCQDSRADIIGTEISQESKTATRKTKDNLDAYSKARFGQRRNYAGFLKRSTAIR